MSSWTTPTTLIAAAALTMLVPSRAEAADPDRDGVQLEGMIGGAACIPGRAPCSYERIDIDGFTRPSFAIGGTVGWRAARFLMIGGLYRMGMFQPDYTGLDVDYSYAMQHTAAVVVRPILPIWRFDLGLNVAPGYSRQVFRRPGSSAREYSHGFAALLGPTVDIWLGEHFFLGAEVDFVFNTQRRLCRRADGTEVCSVDPEAPLAPTHQAMFGLHLGGTLR